MAVSFELLKDTLTVGTSGGTATRIVKVAGSDLVSYLDEKFGVQTIQNIGYLLFIRATHPRWNWLPIETLSAVGFVSGGDSAPQAINANSDITGYEFVRITETYKGEALSLGYGRGANQVPTVSYGSYLTHSRQTATDVMTVEARNYQWSSDSTPVNNDVPVGIRRPTIAHTVVWHRVMKPPRTAFADTVGKVNNASFWVADNTGTETLLFTGAQESDAYIDQNLGIQLTDITLSFMERALKDDEGNWVGWNHAYRSKPGGTGAWDKLIRKDDGATKGPYDTADFSQLFVQV